MSNFLRYMRRAPSALLRVRRVQFFYDDTPSAGSTENVVELSRRDLERIIADKSNPWSSLIGSPSWLDDSGRLFAVKRSGEYVSFGWAMRSETFDVSEIGGTVFLTKAALWIWNCFTLSEHRGRGYYPALLMGIRHALGSPPTVIYCVAENRASRRGIEKAGFKAAFTVAEHRLFVHCWDGTPQLYAGYRRA